jgi:serine/threonine protein kinase
MLRPETAQDVLHLTRQSNLVDVSVLSQFESQLSPDESGDGVLSLLVVHGLLTRYQASELKSGQSRGLWLGGYRVLDRLGKGGMSHVFLAEHAVLGKRVAVKVLSASLRADKIARRRFVREARTAAAIEHPNIVHVFDVDMDHDPPYLVMEFVDGISLQAAVAEYGCFAGNETANVGVEIARGLAVAAEAGLVHRDIKPANLLLDRRGGVKILDLGIVRLLGDDTQPPGTESDEILGTLDYLAPEQAENSAKVDTRADLYSLGATLYFLLAGHPPFPGSNVRHKLAAKQYTDPPPIHRLRPDVDPALSAVIHTLLTRDPAARYQTAAKAIEALSSFAALPADYPMRFFRPLRGSTVTDGIASRSDSASLAATQSIRKPVSSAIAINRQNSAQTDIEEAGEPGPATVRLSKALTDMVMTALPDDSSTAVQEAETNSTAPGKFSREVLPGLFWRAFFVVMACILIIVIALKCS